MPKTEGYKPRVIPLSGKMVLSEDPATIGENFQSLKNLRYTGQDPNTHPQGVGGMTKINTNAPATYFKIRSAFHFQKEQPVESHILTQAYDTGISASRILDNKTVPPAQGNFESTSLFTDGSGAGTGRFSNAPGGNVAYANGVEACIWGGDEHRVARFINYDPNGSFSKDFTNQVTNTLTDANNVATLQSPSSASSWSTQVSAADNGWKAVAWSPENSIFAAVSDSGIGNRVQTSPDGRNWTSRFSAKSPPVTWTIRTSAADNNWRSVAWSPSLSLFVAVADTGSSNRVMTSPDGITWTSRTSAADNDWRSIAWSPSLSLFVAVAETGTGNRVQTSPDGITWTIRTSAANDDWQAVAWSPSLSLFVAVADTGSSNRVMTSPDGITWTIRTSAASTNWRAIAWSPALSLFVAVSGSGSSNRVMTSPDGITWTIRTSAADNNWISIAWSPALSLFAAVSTDGGTNRVMTSPDGITWTIRTTPDKSLRSIAWSPEWEVFVSVSSDGSGNKTVTSSDGIIWTARTSAGNLIWTAIAWSPSLGVFASVSSSGTGNRVQTSLLVDPDWRSVAWSPSLSLFVAVAESGTGDRVMTSPDSIIWTIRTSAADNNWRSVAWSPSLSLFVAVADTGSSNRVMTSPDGITWTIRTSAADNDWNAVTWAPSLSLFAAVAQSGSSNRVMTSPDGITWTTRTSAADNDWNAVVWSVEKSLFVAVSSSGSNNRVMTSANGTSWTIRTSAADNSWFSVAWSPGLTLFVAVSVTGSSNRVMTSPDGITWTIRTSAADNDWYAIAWAPSLSLFAATSNTGSSNRVMTSVSDGTMFFLVGSTRTLKGFKATIGTANAVSGTTVVEYWNGTAWTPVTGLSDGTLSGGIPLAQTGIISFNSTESVAEVRPIDSVVLYWYRLSIVAGVSVTTTISNVTVDNPFQIVKDIWDGDLREEISFQIFEATTFNDNTVNVFDDTFDSANSATFASMGALVASSEYVVVGFSERMLGLSVRLIGGKVNTVAATVATASYWNGASWSEVSVVDGTSENTASFGKSGFITWNPPSLVSEFKREINKGVPLYFYKIEFSKTLSATVDVFHLTGIPAQEEIKGFKFPLFADNRVWLCSETSDEKNAVIVTAANAPDVYNGTDTQRFKFGDEKEMTAAAWLYNQVGDNVRSIKIFTKANETWVIEGTTPATWVKYQLSDKIGCIAPQTMATTTLGGSETQQVAMWRSAKGFVLCDGRSIVLLQQDIRQFFDARAATSINISRAVNETGSIDHEKMEYHWLFSDGSNTTHNRELVYDILRRRWFEIVRGTGKFLQYIFPVQDADGNNFMYGTLDTGFVERLENGTDFDGTAIAHEFHLGDSAFEGVMYETMVRKVKLINVAKTTTANSATITHYGDTSTTGIDLSTFSPKATGKRLADVKKGAKLGPHIFHSFKGVMTADDETVGFEPLAIGLFYKLIREDLR